jgi:hypothetical protein
VIISGVIGAVGAVIAALVARVKLRKPDGYCKAHRVQGELRGVRVGAEGHPNWWCLYGQHFVDRRGHEYEPPAGEKRAAWGLLAGLAALLLWRGNK